VTVEVRVRIAQLRRTAALYVGTGHEVIVHHSAL